MVCAEGHRFLRRNGVLDLSAPVARSGSTERTFASFGYEWNTFEDVRGEDEGFAKVYFRDVDLAGLAGKVGLEWREQGRPLRHAAWWRRRADGSRMRKLDLQVEKSLVDRDVEPQGRC